MPEKVELVKRRQYQAITCKDCEGEGYSSYMSNTVIGGLLQQQCTKCKGLGMVKIDIDKLEIAKLYRYGD